MRHKWEKIGDTEVLINANDGTSSLAFINVLDGKYLLKIPFYQIDVDLKDTSGASTFDNLNDAKMSAETEVQRRIDEFTSPGN